MCGICGTISPFPERVGEALWRMNRCQAHRGPDSEGAQSIDLPSGWTLGLGQRRLSILDLSPDGNQPMLNPATGDWLVFNGEIYNYPELRRDLKRDGAVFTSSSDTEVILKGCARWGVKAIERLCGMFAFAFYDHQRKTLLLARDPLGIKPLYYAWSRSGEFVFASEVRALAASGMIRAEVDRDVLASVLAYGSVPEPLTILKGVRLLGAGEWMELDLNSSPPVVCNRGFHWEIPEAGSFTGTREEAVEALRERTFQAIQSHFLSDVPVGLFLSAGIDSAAIAAVCKQLGQAPVAFTVTLGGFDDINEQPLALVMARQCGLPHHSVRIPSSSVAEWFEQFMSAMDQPTVDGFNTWLISKAIKSHGYKVVLSGLGGDELFGGYNHLREIPKLWRLNRILKRAPSFARKALVEMLACRMLPSHREKLRDILLNPLDLLHVALARNRVFSDGAMERFGFGASAVSEFYDAWVPAESDLYRGASERDVLASLGVLETRHYMGNTLLRDSDVFGMAHGIEIRVPWLDRRIIDLVFSLPGSMRRPRNGINKPMLVEAAGVPDFVALRKKTGFGLPLVHWMRTDLREIISQSLASLVDDGVLAEEGVDAVRKSFERNPTIAEGSRLWMLMVLGCWLRSFNADARLGREQAHAV